MANRIARMWGLVLIALCFSIMVPPFVGLHASSGTPTSDFGVRQAFHTRSDVGAPEDQAIKNPAAFRQDDQFLYVSNDRIELTFQKSDGRLYAIVDKLSGLDFLAKKEAYWGPFRFWMLVDGKDENLFGGNVAQFSLETITNNGGTILTLTWDQFRTSTGRIINVQVRITVNVPASGGLTYWRIAITNNEDLPIREVDFPDLHGIPQLSRDGKNDYLAYPSMSGMLFRDPVNNINLNRGYGLGYPSAYSNMQFTALYSNETGTGLYLATKDTEGTIRTLNAYRLNLDWMSLSIMNPLTRIAGNGFAPSYDTVLGVFSGDWFDAAQIYRAWAVEQEWAKNASLKRLGGAPDWFKLLGVHRWDHTYIDCQNINPFANVPILAKETSDWAGSPIAVDWVGWENFGWYINYPKVFPPKEGWPSFDNAVSLTQGQGNLIWLVADTTGFSSRLAEWTQAEPNALLDSQGGYPYPFEFTECGQHTTFFQMCPATQYWQNELHTLLMEFAGRKPDIIQLDGFPVVPATPCYSNSHGHLPGAPSLYANTYRMFFENLKVEARGLNPRVQFSAEGMAEFYLGFLDSMWDAFSTGWSPTSLVGSVADPLLVELVPLWQAVYHDHALLQSGLVLFNRKDTDESGYYIRGMARALVWGETPSFATDRGLPQLNLPREQEMKAYLKHIIEARRGYAASFLVEGRMLRPPVPDVPTIALPGATNIPYNGGTYPPSTSPAVLSSLWRATDGSVGYVYTNISQNPVTFPLTISSSETLLPSAGPYAVIRNINGTQSTLMAGVSLPQTLSININPLDVLLIKIAAQAIAATGSATNITGETATLNGMVNPNGVPTTYYFEWGTTPAYGNTTAVQSAGSGLSDVDVSANLTGLTRNTTYHYRIVAVNSLGTSYGLDRSFKASIQAMPWLMLLLGD